MTRSEPPGSVGEGGDSARERETEIGRGEKMSRSAEKASAGRAKLELDGRNARNVLYMFVQILPRSLYRSFSGGSQSLLSLPPSSLEVLGVSVWIEGFAVRGGVEATWPVGAVTTLGGH